MAFTTDQSEQVLRDGLQKAGFFTDPISAEKAWHCFKEFSHQEFVCQEDLLLWETGLFSYKDQRYFFCAMVRQFAHEDHMEQLHLELHFKPDETLSGLNGELWSEDFKDLAGFYQAVESSESFRTPFTQYTPFAYKLYWEQL